MNTGIDTPGQYELELIEEIEGIVSMGMHVDEYTLNPEQGYALTCHDELGSYLIVDHWGFVTSAGPWSRELVNTRFREQCILLGGES